MNFYRITWQTFIDGKIGPVMAGEWMKNKGVSRAWAGQMNRDYQSIIHSVEEYVRPVKVRIVKRERRR